MRPLGEQTILVTGATDGLGRGVAAELAGRGATVLIHGRDPGKVEETVAGLSAATGNERLRPYLADLSSLEQVRPLAERITGENEELHALINNAGIGTAEPGDGERVESD